MWPQQKGRMWLNHRFWGVDCHNRPWVRVWSVENKRSLLMRSGSSKECASASIVTTAAENMLITCGFKHCCTYFELWPIPLQQEWMVQWLLLHCHCHSLQDLDRKINTEISSLLQVVLIYYKLPEIKASSSIPQLANLAQQVAILSGCSLVKSIWPRALWRLDMFQLHDWRAEAIGSAKHSDKSRVMYEKMLSR